MICIWAWRKIHAIGRPHSWSDARFPVPVWYVHYLNLWNALCKWYHRVHNELWAHLLASGVFAAYVAGISMLAVYVEKALI